MGYAIGILAAFVLILAIRAFLFRPYPQAEVPACTLAVDKERAVANLAKMVQCRTVSSKEEGRAEEGEFEKFRQLLPENYPLVHSHCEFWRVGPNGLLYRWPGKRGGKPTVFMAHYDVVPAAAQDWQHPDSKTAMLKVQHPEFETWSTGVHGQAGVSCADCHMPYMRQDGQKYTSHWVTSPLKHLDASCTTCHDQGSAWLQERVKTIQNHTWQLQHSAGLVVAKAHAAIKKASEVPQADQAELAQARELVRRAQWNWDFVAAENSMGFHNPDQVLHTCGQAMELGYKAIESANRAAGIEFF